MLPCFEERQKFLRDLCDMVENKILIIRGDDCKRAIKKFEDEGHEDRFVRCFFRGQPAVAVLLPDGLSSAKLDTMIRNSYLHCVYLQVQCDATNFVVREVPRPLWLKGDDSGAGFTSNHPCSPAIFLIMAGRSGSTMS